MKYHYRQKVNFEMLDFLKFFADSGKKLSLKGELPLPGV